MKNIKSLIRKRSRKHLAGKILLGLLAVLLLLGLLPFLIPLSSATGQELEEPFANSQFAAIDGVELHYRVWNQSTAGCQGKVLLVHGMGGSTYCWEQNVAALTDAGYWVMAVDLPGFGYSSRMTGLDHSQKSRGQLLWRLLQSVGGQVPPDVREESWNLVGHSMGGGTIAAMALEKPDQAQRLIFVDGALFESSPTFLKNLALFPPVARWTAVILEYAIIKPARIQKVLSYAYGQEATAEQAAAYLAPLRLSGSARSFLDIVRTTKNEPATGLNNFPGLVFAVWGTDDQVIPVSQADQLKQLLPGMAFQSIPGAGHIPMETHAAAFNEILLDFLASD